jgi:8-oxo-dGTP diphosphatase
LNYSGVVYVFDFDDTLMWAPDWYEDATLDTQGHVIHPGTSGALQVSTSFLNSIHEPEELVGMKLRKEVVPQQDKRNIYFLLVDSRGNAVSIDRLLEHFPSSELDSAHIKVNQRYSQFAAVTDDNDFYRGLHTVGEMGVNEEIMDLYRRHSDNAVILTARGDYPGMKDKIRWVIAEHGGAAPLEVYVQPTDSNDSGAFKGAIISGIALQESVEHVYFYDDNPKYIEGVKKVVDTIDGLSDKVTVHQVQTDDKPPYTFKIANAMVQIANKLDKQRLFKQANKVDGLIKELFEFNEEDRLDQGLRSVGTVAVVDEDKVLILQRSEDVNGGGWWNFPGGSIEEGESVEEGTVRELKEEASLLVDSSNLTEIGTLIREDLAVNFFITDQFSGEVKINWESDDYEWVTIDELDNYEFVGGGKLYPGILESIVAYMEDR